MRKCLTVLSAVAWVTFSLPLQAETYEPKFSYRIISEHPHDTSRFTQGLVVHDGRVYESAGGYGRSSISVTDRSSGALLRNRPLPTKLFAEGLAVLDNRLILLTWREGIGLVFDRELRNTGQFAFNGEGWGLAAIPWQGKPHLIMSNGSSKLKLIDPSTMRAVRELLVQYQGEPVRQLNELEYAEGLLYANVWQTDRVAVILPHDGRVVAWVDFSALKTRFKKPPGWRERDHVLNGIAYDGATRSFLVTGKCWPTIFEVDIEHTGTEPAQ